MSPDPKMHAIRNAINEDIDAIAQIWHFGWHLAHDGLVPEYNSNARTLAHFRERIIPLLKDTFVINSGAEITGFYVLVEDELNQFYVAKSAIGGGIPKPLMMHALEELKARGFSRAWLACGIGNDRAACFYEKMGWKNVGISSITIHLPSGSEPLEIWRFERGIT